ncbi:hypothetical protein RvY_10798 [Ramazzottius varieornatus]|uniref:Thioredoxin n=1 Tax=Ramazzottius varieornatus TaxID=947166 RepID=A0A1D1VMY1_RAMVA|nr:hypothetical protein RvY_10798 [Ramazzottius varieornatus]
MATKAQHITDKAALDKILKDAGSKLVVIDFHATWCGPCRQIGPKFEEFSSKYADVIFLKVDVDEAEDIPSEYEISVMPTFIFIKNGKPVETFSGANAGKLEDMIKKHK